MSDGTLLDTMSVQSMEKAFTRSERVHQASMASISRSLSLEKSVELLNKSSKLTPALAEVTRMVLTGQSNLRKQRMGDGRRRAPVGYSGVDGARKLLNDMIFEAMSEYDEEIAKCTNLLCTNVLRGTCSRVCCTSDDICGTNLRSTNDLRSTCSGVCCTSDNICGTDLRTTSLRITSSDLLYGSSNGRTSLGS